MVALCCSRAGPATTVAQRMTNQDDMGPMFDALNDLTIQQRAAIKERYHFMMRDYRRRCAIYAWLFYVLRITMTVGSLTVPALISIKTYTSTSSDIDSALYWFTWALSLAVTTANGLITLFKLDKRYFAIHATAERLRSETWQYLSLSGRYSGIYGGLRPTHKNQYVYYFSKIEKIRMKHVSDEFVRAPSGGVDENKGSAGGPSSPNQSESPSQGRVPTPPDQATLPRKPTAVAGGMVAGRRDSESTVGTDDTAIAVAANEESASVASSLQMHRRDGGALRPAGPAGPTVLPPTHEQLPAGAEKR
jgi:hypothetical protein